MTNSELSAIANVVGAHVKKYVADATRDLRARVAELEQRPAMKYAGVWRADKTYDEQAMVTHGGSVWVAVELPMKGVRPGDASLAGRAWQLAAKSHQR